MKLSKTAWAASIAWLALISAANRGEPAGAWLAAWTIALAPLALCLLAAILPKHAGLISAAEAEALAWERHDPPPAPRRAKGKAIPAEGERGAWRTRPLAA